MHGRRQRRPRRHGLRDALGRDRERRLPGGGGDHDVPHVLRGGVRAQLRQPLPGVLVVGVIVVVL